ncbi:Protocadherin-17 [Manis pentadactyla]|nr:Protocadherin-17 [Manis pentadactyla]
MVTVLAVLVVLVVMVMVMVLVVLVVTVTVMVLVLVVTVMVVTVVVKTEIRTHHVLLCTWCTSQLQAESQSTCVYIHKIGMIRSRLLHWRWNEMFLKCSAEHLAFSELGLKVVIPSPLYLLKGDHLMIPTPAVNNRMVDSVELQQRVANGAQNTSPAPVHQEPFDEFNRPQEESSHVGLAVVQSVSCAER